MVGVGQCDQRAALDYEKRRLADRLRRIVVRVAHPEAEHFSRQIERADLTPSVAENLVGARGAGNDLVHVFGWLAVSENLLVARIRDWNAHRLKCAQTCAI